jgi:hypothetical protein
MNTTPATLERCAICGCKLHRTRDTYARPTVAGRSHATKHHNVAERFFGRSSNRRGTQNEGIFEYCPWEYEGETVVFCYECHEELIHNPVLLPEAIAGFALLVTQGGFSEVEKTESRKPIAGRIKLMQKVIAAGISALLEQSQKPEPARLSKQIFEDGAALEKPAQS